MVTAVNDHYVYLVNAQSQIERRLVVVGDWNGGNWIINQGLAAGDRVAIGDLSKVHAGLTVKPVVGPAPPPGQTPPPAPAARPGA